METSVKTPRQPEPSLPQEDQQAIERAERHIRESSWLYDQIKGGKLPLAENADQEAASALGDIYIQERVIDTIRGKHGLAPKFPDRTPAAHAPNALTPSQSETIGAFKALGLEEELNQHREELRFLSTEELPADELREKLPLAVRITRTRTEALQRVRKEFNMVPPTPAAPRAPVSMR